MKFYEKDMRAAYGETLVELGETCPDVVVLDSDLRTSTLTSLFAARFPRRFIQCGIAEADMMGIAAGFSHAGFVTFPSTFAAFLERRALDSFYMHCCLQREAVKAAGAYPGLTAAECGPSHNACEDLAVMRAMPGLRVLDPGDNAELRAAMLVMAREEGPVYFRVSKATLPVLFGRDYQFVWGRGYLLRDGHDLAILSTGMMTAAALKASILLEEAGISAQVAHLPSVKPIDEELIARCARKTGAVLTVENGRAEGGFGGAVAQVLAREYPVPASFMGLGDEPAGSDGLASLLRRHGLTPESVAAKAKELMERRRHDA